MLPRPIDADQTDAKSPVDDDLMESIREDLDYLYLLAALTASATYEFKYNGPLAATGGRAKRIDVSHVSFDQQFSMLKAYLEKPGTSGTLELDIKKVKSHQIAITSMAHQFYANTQSIARGGVAMNTQSIVRGSPSLAVQTIDQYKSNINITKIISLGGTTFQAVLASNVDTDWEVGDYIYIQGCTNPANDGTFEILSIAPNGSRKIVNYTNASGVAQGSAAGSATLSAVSYNFANPVDEDAFFPGEAFIASGCTDAEHNGTFIIYSVNDGANNVVAKSASFDGNFSQGSAAGNVDCFRWIYTLNAVPSSTYFVEGEQAYFSGHTSGGNNGNQTMRKISGNQITVFNMSGAAQGGVLGTVESNLWLYNYSVNPSLSVAVGDNVTFDAHTSSANDLESAAVRIVNATQIGIYNINGVIQAGVAGNVVSDNKILSMLDDESAELAIGDLVEIIECDASEYNTLATSNLGYEVKAVNFGGGSNYNVVIERAGGTEFSTPSGYIYGSSRSLLTNTLTMDFNEDINAYFQVATSTDFIASPVDVNSVICLYILQVPAGNPNNLVAQLA